MVFGFSSSNWLNFASVGSMVRSARSTRGGGFIIGNNDPDDEDEQGITPDPPPISYDEDNNDPQSKIPSEVYATPRCICPSCEKVLSSMRSLFGHCGRAHRTAINQEMIKYMCPFCDASDEVFGTTAELEHHVSGFHPTCTLVMTLTENLTPGSSKLKNTSSPNFPSSTESLAKLKRKTRYQSENKSSSKQLLCKCPSCDKILPPQGIIGHFGRVHSAQLGGNIATFEWKNVSYTCPFCPEDSDVSLRTFRTIELAEAHVCKSHPNCLLIIPNSLSSTPKISPPSTKQDLPMRKSQRRIQRPSMLDEYIDDDLVGASKSQQGRWSVVKEGVVPREDESKLLYKCPDCNKTNLTKHGLHAHYGMKHGGAADFAKVKVIRPKVSKSKKNEVVSNGIGQWSEEEHEAFLEGYKKYGNRWTQISAEYVPTRDAKQVGSHALNYFTSRGEWHNVGVRRTGNSGDKQPGTISTPMGEDDDKEEEASDADSGRESDDEENEANSASSDSDDGNSSHCICCFEGGNIVCCSKCPRAYHPKCLAKDRLYGGGVNVDLLPHDWQCHRCKKDVEVMSGEEIPQYAFGNKKIRTAYAEFKDCSDYNSCCTLLSNLLDILKKLMSYDYGYVFAEPVNLEGVPDYLEIIQNPMDYGTVIERLEGGNYVDLITSDDVSRDDENSTMEEILVHVLCDIERVSHNCQLYNKKGSSIYRIGDVHAHKWSAYFNEYIYQKLPENVDRDLTVFRRNCRLQRYGKSSSKLHVKKEGKIGKLSTPSPATHRNILTHSRKRKAFEELEEDAEDDQEDEEEDEEDGHEDEDEEECHRSPKRSKHEESQAGHSSAVILTEKQLRSLECVFFSSASKLREEADELDACSPFSLVDCSPSTNNDESNSSPSALPRTPPGDRDGLAPTNVIKNDHHDKLGLKPDVSSSDGGDTTSLLIPASCSALIGSGVDVINEDKVSINTAQNNSETTPRNAKILAQNALDFSTHPGTTFQQQWFERLNDLKRYKIAHGTAVASATITGKLYHWRLRQRKRYHLTLHRLPHLKTDVHAQDESNGGNQNDKQWLLTMPEMKGMFSLSASYETSKENAPKLLLLERKDVELDEKTVEFIRKKHQDQLYCPLSYFAPFGTKVTVSQQHSSRHLNSLFWDECLEELRFFEGEHQHTLVPRDFPHNSYLPIWVEIQRAKYLLQSTGLFSGLTGAQMLVLDELNLCDFSSLPTAGALLKADSRAIPDGTIVRSSPEKGIARKGSGKNKSKDGERKSWSTNFENFKAWSQDLPENKAKACELLPRLNWPLYSWCWRQCNSSSAILRGTPNIIGVNMTVKKLGMLSSSGFFHAFPYNDMKSGLVCEDDYEGCEAFDTTFELLEDISIKYSTTHIPDWYECDKALRMWLLALESSFSSLVKGGPCVLSVQQIEKLILIGFCRDRDGLPNLSRGDVVWFKMLQELKTHLELFGVCHVSSDFPRLHKWIAEQKELFLQSRTMVGRDVMNPSRLKMLMEAGIDFFTGECLPGEHDFQEFDILTASPVETFPVHERVTNLNVFSFDSYWNNHECLEKFEKLKAINGHSLVLASDDEDVYLWFMEKRGKILLSEIDSGLFSHSVLQYITTTVNDDGSKVEAVEVDRSMFLWLHYYERLLIFKAREGHCKVPNEYPDMPLRRWLSQQHDLLHLYSVNRSIDLRPVQLKLLHTIGIHGSKQQEKSPTLSSRVLKRKCPSRKKVKQFYLEKSKNT